MRRIPRVVVFMEISRGYGRSVLRGIASYSQTHGPWMVELRSPYYPVESGRTLSLGELRAGAYDGAVMRDWEGLDTSPLRRIPHIIFHYRQPARPNMCSAVVDDTSTGKMVAEYFMQRGYRHYAFLGYDNMFWSRNRKVSFTHRLREAGFRVETMKQVSPRRQRALPEGDVPLAKWLEGLKKPVALFACNDDRALEAAAACRLADLQIPHEVAICGVDDDEFLCKLAYPTLSSVRLNLEHASYRAAHVLDQMMKGLSPGGESIVVDPLQVVTRVSTDTMGIEDPDVRAAVKYIRENRRNPIAVKDVVKHTCLSRRGLYDRFSRLLGHTIYEEITSVRLSEIEHLLLDTRLPVSEIAYLVGFMGSEHIAQYFRKHRGMTPSEFRKNYTPP